MTKDINNWEDFCEVKTSYASEGYKKDCVKFTTTCLFRTKEEYLTFREFWKGRYKELSLEIREQKKALRKEMKEQAKGGGEIIYDCWRSQGNLSASQREARKMMSALEQAKLIARSQAEASRTELAAANG